MKEVIVKTTTAENGSIHIESTDIEPGTEVEVRVQPVDIVKKYNLKPYKPKPLTRCYDFPGDPVEFQRKVRDEWDR